MTDQPAALNPLPPLDTEMSEGQRASVEQGRAPRNVANYASLRATIAGFLGGGIAGGVVYALDQSRFWLKTGIGAGIGAVLGFIISRIPWMGRPDTDQQQPESPGRAGAQAHPAAPARRRSAMPSRSPPRRAAEAASEAAVAR